MADRRSLAALENALQEQVTGSQERNQNALDDDVLTDDYLTYASLDLFEELTRLNETRSGCSWCGHE